MTRRSLDVPPPGPALGAEGSDEDEVLTLYYLDGAADWSHCHIDAVVRVDGGHWPSPWWDDAGSGAEDEPGHSDSEPDEIDYAEEPSDSQDSDFCPGMARGAAASSDEDSEDSPSSRRMRSHLRHGFWRDEHLCLDAESDSDSSERHGDPLTSFEREEAAWADLHREGRRGISLRDSSLLDRYNRKELRVRLSDSDLQYDDLH